MLTNLVQILHMTAAYQAAATQLMVGHAEWAAHQLGLKEKFPLAIERNTNEWSVSPAPWGVGGMIMTSNYVYGFSKGRLNWITRRSSPNPSPAELEALTHKAVVLDTNGVYTLATNWLSHLSVDVAKLTKQFPAKTVQRMIYLNRTNESGQVIHPQIPGPYFDVAWAADSFSSSSVLSAVSLRIDGSVPELQQLHIRKNSFYEGNPLKVADAEKLLGPLPKPKHFVEKLMGGPGAYETVASPDKVEAWLLDTESSSNGVTRTESIKLNGNVARAFSEALVDFDSYAWTESKLCLPSYAVRLRFTRNRDLVEIMLCFDCDILQISHRGYTKEENFDFAHNRLAEAIKRAFPHDQLIQAIESRDEQENSAEYEAAMRQYEK